jgi:hypothetical protein
MPANFIATVILYLIVMLGLFPTVIVGQAVAQTSPADEPYSLSYAAGGNDAQGNFLGGTEFMHVVAFNGMLYGGLSYWEDVPGNDPNSQAQILVLNSYNGQWQQEWLFHHNRSDGDVDATRVNSLDVVTFHSYDASGNVTGTYPPILTAGLAKGTGAVFTQQSPGKWVNTLLPSSQAVRSIVTHLIPGGNTETLFTGVGTKDAPGTVSYVYTGTYDPSVPGQISWNQMPETLDPQGGRVMSMVDCDGYLFAAVKPYIYRRNDQTNSWEQFFTYATNNNSLTSGFRALTCTSLSGGQLALMTSLEGPGDIFTIDPQTGAGSIVVNTWKSLTRQWGGAPVAGVITGYDDEDVTPVTSAPDTFQLTGLGSESPIANEQNAAWFLSCELNDYGCDFNSAQSTSQPPYWLFEVPALLPWPYSRSDTALRSIRTIAVSPFPEDQGQVMYLGGYDARNKPAHNTAWLYRVGIDYALGR